MSEVLRYLIFIILVSIAIILVYSILKKSFAKNRTIYLNNLEDLSTHYYRYLLYFWGVGILIPFSELYIDLFSVRAKSELIFNLSKQSLYPDKKKFIQAFFIVLFYIQFSNTI
jgi:preprotein translocase subunit SecE